MADEQIHIVETTVPGRYIVREPAHGPATRALVGFHGYGQNAGEMIDELARLPGTNGWLLVSIQALNRFYDRGRNRVVGCWMTSEDREPTIAANIRYIDAVMTAIKNAHPIETVVHLGFSQGVAMAFRAAAFSAYRSHGVVALGGDVPPDVRGAAILRVPPVVIARGLADTWYRADTFAGDVEWLESVGSLRAAVEFEGGHEFGQTFRIAAGAVLASLS